MCKKIFILCLLLAFAVLLTSCKKSSGINSQTDTSSGAFVNDSSSIQSEESLANSTDEDKADGIDSQLVDDWSEYTNSTETTSTETATSSNSTSSDSTSSNVSQQTGSNDVSKNDEAVSSETQDDSSSVISVPEFYEGRY